MTNKEFAAIILAAGRGTRMKSNLHKPLHQVGCKPMVRHVVDSCAQTGASKIVVVKAEDDPFVDKIVAPFPTTIQKDRLGTGHATQIGLKAIAGFEGMVLVTLGDMPFIQPETFKKVVDQDDDITVLAMRVDDPKRYGRLITDESGKLHRIVEFKDATPKELRVNLCNAGTVAVRASLLQELLAEVDNKNAAGEYYLYDIIGLANKRGLHCGVVEVGGAECAGANSREELAALEDILQTNLRCKAMDGGATLFDPDTVYFCTDTVIGQDVVIEPNVFFGPGVTVGDNVTIKSFCRFENTTIESGTIIGPFENMFSTAKDTQASNR